MSRLFVTDTPTVPKRVVVDLTQAKIIRNRKKNPLHPEEIERQLRERASQLLSAKPTPKEWLLILWIDDPITKERTKRYSDLIGEYDKVIKYRDHILEARSDVHGHMLIWKTERWKHENP